jgi:GTP-binding protein HflX
LHIVDITHHNAAEQFQTVEEILADLHLDKKPQIAVLNKMDLVMQSENELTELTAPLKLPNDRAVPVSALKGWGLDKLLDKIALCLAETPESHFSM